MYIMSVWPMPKWLVILVDVVGVSRKNAPGGGCSTILCAGLFPQAILMLGLLCSSRRVYITDWMYIYGRSS